MFKKFLPQIIATLFLAGFVVYAWTEPSSAPPAGNVDAPINVGTTTQYKAGALGIGGVLRGYLDLIIDGKVGIGTMNPQGELDVGGGKLVVTTEGATNFTAGPNNPGASVNDGGLCWQDLSNALVSDNNYAEGLCLSAFDRQTNYLKVTGFNFSLPSIAVIDGIKVEIERWAKEINPGESVKDHSVYIVKRGIIDGLYRASPNYWPTTDTNTYQSYGGLADRWGLAWTTSDINSPNFGVAVSALLGLPDSPGSYGLIPKIDHIRITVYYHAGGIDVVKVGDVTIAGDGSVSPNLNADKLDDQHASELRPPTGLYGWCSQGTPGTFSGGQCSAFSPAFCQPPVWGIQPTCECPAGYGKVVTGYSDTYNVWYIYFSCYKN